MILLFSVIISVNVDYNFTKNYSSGVKALKQDYAEARGVATVRTVKDGKAGRPRAYHFATGPNRRKFEFENAARGIHYGYAELDGRSIEVQRNDPAEPYLIRGIGDDDPIRRASFDALFGKYLNAPWGFGGRDIAGAYRRGFLEILETIQIEENGQALVQVTFHRAASNPSSFHQIAFDPSFHWAIVRAESWEDDPSNPSERYEVTYGPTASGKPYMKTVRWWGLDGKERLCEFEQVAFEPTPESEFTLEHYGMGSPPLPETGPDSRLIVAVVIAALILLIGAWYARRLATR